MPAIEALKNIAGLPEVHFLQNDLKLNLHSQRQYPSDGVIHFVKHTSDFST